MKIEQPQNAIKGETKKESAGDFATLKQLGKKVKELNDRYESEMQREEKAKLWNQLEATQKEYRELEKKLDTILMPTEQEKKMFRLKELKEKIRELNEKYKSEMQREEKAILYSQLEKTKKEADKLEEELDNASSKKPEPKPEPIPPATPEPVPPTPEPKPATPEGKEGFIVILIGLLEKANGGDPEAVKILIEFIVTHKIEIAVTGRKLTPDEEVTNKIFIILLEKLRGGDVTVINQLIQIINVNINIVNITIITTPPTPPPVPPITPEPVPPTPESGASLDELRDLYLKAKRLRGNVFRGGFGKFLKRKLSFGKEEMDFGGKEGAKDLEKVRNEYQEKLSQERSAVLAKLQADLEAKAASGTITVKEANAQIQEKIINLLSEEQKNIDERAEGGIEKNMFEKMKTKWRQYGKTRLITGALLGAAAFTGVGGAAVVGARATMGGIGTYVGAEAGLERYSKLVGHKGLVTKISKAEHFITEDALYKHILSLPNEDVKGEAARLRMLQVEKGVSMDNLKTLGDDGRIAQAIIKRDNEISAETIMSSGISLATLAKELSDRLAIEVNLKNEVIESEVDRERVKKMFRKTTAALAGGAVGWLIGGKLFQKPEIINPTHPDLISSHGPEGQIPADTSEVTANITHVVTPGENTWKIIESNLDSQDTMAGLGEGARTHMVDALKDQFDNMSPESLKGLGFSSGDANLLYVGNSLDMSSVMTPEMITKTLFNAKHLPTKDIMEIVKNNTTIAKWLAEHYSELKTPLNSSVIEQVLKNIK